jgi:glucuronokinase
VITSTQAFARAGLVGNPSDGFYGKTISCSVRNYAAHVTLFESPDLVIEPHRNDRTEFSGLEDLVEDVRLTGYYGGLRLIKAAAVRFWRYCRERDLELPARNFTIRYDSSVPVRVGLAGSSAIITAALRALMEFYGVEIPRDEQPSVVLSAETRELGIPAGLQDRVVQTYEGLVYMDFSRQIMEEYGHGSYAELDPGSLPPLFVAHSAQLGEGTEIPHSDLRKRFEAGDRKVHRAMREFAELTDRFRAALEDGKVGELHAVINRNFDLRASIVGISDRNWQLVNTARNAGASAKFCGSGGAVVGICEDEDLFCALATEFAEIGAEVIRPEVAPPEEPEEPGEPGEPGGSAVAEAAPAEAVEVEEGDR